MIAPVLMPLSSGVVIAVPPPSHFPVAGLNV
jgi:hypothetical protein